MEIFLGFHKVINDIPGKSQQPLKEVEELMISPDGVSENWMEW